MKGLKTLVRMNRLKLEDKQRQLGELEGVAGGFRSQIAALEESVRLESGAAEQTPDLGYRIGGFVQASLARRETLRLSLADIAQQIKALRDEVAAAFREIKRYELIMERREEAARREAGKRARKIEDETAMTVYRRGRKAAAA